MAPRRRPNNNATPRRSSRIRDAAATAAARPAPPPRPVRRRPRQPRPARVPAHPNAEHRARAAQLTQYYPSLTIETYPPGTLTANRERCGICAEVFQNNQQHYSHGRCGERFHLECFHRYFLDQVIQKGSVVVVCPNEDCFRPIARTGSPAVSYVNLTGSSNGSGSGTTSRTTSRTTNGNANGNTDANIDEVVDVDSIAGTDD